MAVPMCITAVKTGDRVDMRGVGCAVMKVVIGAYWEVTTVWPRTKVPDVSEGHAAGRHTCKFNACVTVHQ